MFRKLIYANVIVLFLTLCVGMWSCSDSDELQDMTPEQILMWGNKSGILTVTSGAADIYFKSYHCKEGRYSGPPVFDSPSDPDNTFCSHHWAEGILFRDAEPYLVSYVFNFNYFGYNGAEISSESRQWVNFALRTAKLQPTKNLLNAPIIKKITWNSDQRFPELYLQFEEDTEYPTITSAKICTFTDDFLVLEREFSRTHYQWFKAVDLSEISSPEVVIIENRFQYYTYLIDVLERVFPDQQCETDFGILNLERLREAIDADLTYGPDHVRARRIITGFSEE